MQPTDDKPRRSAVKDAALMGLVGAGTAAWAISEWDDAGGWNEQSVLFSKKGAKIIGVGALVGIAVGTLAAFLPDRESHVQRTGQQPEPTLTR